MPDSIPLGNDVGSQTPSSDDSNWGAPTHGTDTDGNDVTMSQGLGSREGETLLSDGHQNPDSFMNSENHDHYGSGDGSNDNGTDRGQYTGEGSE